MKKVDLFKYAILFLGALNIVLLGFIFFSHPRGPGPRKGPPPHHILNLDPDQEKTFHQIVHNYIEDLEPLNSKENAILMDLVRSKLDLNDSLKLTYKNIKLEKLQLEIAHFKEIKRLLREDQFSNFDDFINKVLTKNKNRPSHRHRRRN